MRLTRREQEAGIDLHCIALPNRRNYTRLAQFGHPIPVVQTPCLGGLVNVMSTQYHTTRGPFEEPACSGIYYESPYLPPSLCIGLAAAQP